MKNNEKWQQDIEVYRKIYSSFIIEGMINDKQPVFMSETFCQSVELTKYLNDYFTELGYDSIVFFNIIDNFHNKHNFLKLKSDSLAINDIKNNVDCKDQYSDLTNVANIVRNIMNNEKQASVIILEMANTFSMEPDRLNAMERFFYSELMLAAMESKKVLCENKELLPNLLILLVEKSNDIPAWFYLNNPHVKILTISKPDKEVRNAIISTKINTLYKKSDYLEQDFFEEKKSKIIEELVFQTENMSIIDIEGVVELFRGVDFEIKNVKNIIKLFKYGKKDSNWEKIDFKNRKSILTQRVKGQDKAIKKTIEILGKACAGLSDFDSDGRGRPRGVLFFAGPTGTGKTKLAKAISEMIFGDENFVVRFDMSEYSQPHSDQRLIGAPPGYVGYNAGGQLTNAVKEKPFCILLFDEIDKADSSILDKFLQIIDDGRLTDSSGETVYFSETLIIFTSNLGVIETKPNGEKIAVVNNTMSYEEVSKNIISSIKRYFEFGMAKPRPELLSRIGDNFVVFDYIRDVDRYDDNGNKLDSIAMEILKIEIGNVIAHLKDTKEIELVLSENIYDYLYNLIKESDVLDKGGRGIRNLVESELASKIGLVIIEENTIEGKQLYVDDIMEDTIQYRII